jgi:hypothetical protein
MSFSSSHFSVEFASLAAYLCVYLFIGCLSGFFCSYRDDTVLVGRKTRRADVPSFPFLYTILTKRGYICSFFFFVYSWMAEADDGGAAAGAGAAAAAGAGAATGPKSIYYFMTTGTFADGTHKIVAPTNEQVRREYELGR